jgi:hypothetical protein
MVPPMRRASAVLLLASLALSAPAASVATLTGGHEQGELALAGGRLTVAGRELALADCDWLRLDDGAESPARPRPEPLGVWLVDGSWLPAERIAGAAAADRLRVAGPLGELELPLAALAGWGAGDLAAAPAGGDDRVVVAAGPLAGRVRGISEGRLLVATALDPQPIAIALEDVRELRLAQPLRAPAGTVLVAALDPRRPPLRLVPAAAGGLALAAAPGVAVAGAALGGVRIRVDGPRRVWLSALKPAQVQEEGSFGVVWPWKADSDLDGGPLLLGGRRWDRGLSVHARARLAWTLDGAYVRLRALAGIADLIGAEGDCAASVLGDGKELWKRASIKGGDAPLALDLDLAGVRELVLQVDFGARYDIGDHFTLAEACLVRR